jgi:hypothetical protein
MNGSLNIIHLLALGAAQYLFIFLKAFQQRSVIHNTRWAVVPTSFTMALFEVFVLAGIAKTAVTGSTADLALVALVLGIGGGTGCLTAMRIHDRVLRNGNR